MNSEQQQEHKESVYPLNKKIICSLCGNTFSSHSQKGKRYYRCQGYTRKKICTAKKIDADKIEKTIKDLTMEIIEDRWRQKPKNRTMEERFNDKSIRYVFDGLIQINSATLKLMRDMKDTDISIEDKVKAHREYSERIRRLLDCDLQNCIDFERMMHEKAMEEWRNSKIKCTPPGLVSCGTVMWGADHYRNLKPEEFFNTCIKEIHYDINEKKGYFTGKILDFVKNFTL